MSNINSTYKILTFSPGMELYHLTTINSQTKECQQELIDNGSDYILNLPPNTYSKDLHSPKYFGIIPEFPYYYMPRYKVSCPFVTLKYQTSKILTLIDVGHKDYKDLKLIQKLFFQNNTSNNPVLLDGWIGFDDKDDWREIYLFEPYKHLQEISEEYTLPSDQIIKTKTDQYMFGKKEIESLNKKLLSVYNIHISNGISFTPSTDFSSQSLTQPFMPNFISFDEFVKYINNQQINKYDISHQLKVFAKPGNEIIKFRTINGQDGYVELQYNINNNTIYPPL